MEPVHLGSILPITLSVSLMGKPLSSTKIFPLASRLKALFATMSPNLPPSSTTTEAIRVDPRV